MLDEESYEWDNEVPLQASFHRCSKTQTLKEKVNEICNSNKISELHDILLIIDTQNKGLKKLLSFDISSIRGDVDIGNSYRNNDKFLAFRLKKYPKEFKSENKKIALGCLLDVGRPICEGSNYAYIPIAVPSKYIVGVVLPKKLENDENFVEFLYKTYPNADVLTSTGNVLNPIKNARSL